MKERHLNLSQYTYLTIPQFIDLTKIDPNTFTYEELEKYFPNGPVRTDFIALFRKKREEMLLNSQEFIPSIPFDVTKSGVVSSKKED